MSRPPRMCRRVFYELVCRVSARAVLSSKQNTSLGFFHLIFASFSLKVFFLFFNSKPVYDICISLHDKSAPSSRLLSPYHYHHHHPAVLGPSISGSISNPLEHGQVRAQRRCGCYGSHSVGSVIFQHSRVGWGI